jgi:hypothetical protein
MIDLLRRRGMIPAIVLACAAVTVITWAGLATLGRESPRVTPSSAPTIHAYLLPVIVGHIVGQGERPVRPSAAHKRPTSIKDRPRVSR